MINDPQELVLRRGKTRSPERPGRGRSGERGRCLYIPPGTTRP